MQNLINPCTTLTLTGVNVICASASGVNSPLSMACVLCNNTTVLVCTVFSVTATHMYHQPHVSASLTLSCSYSWSTFSSSVINRWNNGNKWKVGYRDGLQHQKGKLHSKDIQNYTTPSLYLCNDPLFLPFKPFPSFWRNDFCSCS